MSTMSSFKTIERKDYVYRGIDHMKKFCESLREHAMRIIVFKEEKNEVINIWTGELISKFKNLLHKQRKTWK